MPSHSHALPGPGRSRAWRHDLRAAWSVARLSLLVGLWGCTPSGPPAPLEFPSESIAAAPLDEPLEFGVRLQQGSFVRSKSNPEAMLREFGRELRRVNLFTEVRDPGIGPAANAAQSDWRLILSAADYGEPNAYTFELQGLLVRGDEPMQSYASKQSVRQARGQLTIGPEELAQLAERSIRDLVRQLAGDSERLSRLASE